jgi:4-diphosphocytidyl-2-C-methyl-D-erythritol kinase
LTRAREIAPAKLNLALHVRGKLPDGRHAIETIFAFCNDGDELTIEEAQDHSIYELFVTGPFGGEIGPGNLITSAWGALELEDERKHNVLLTLDKRLPVASGIGGGSADAAAALRLMERYWNLDRTLIEKAAAKVGSDVPACLLSRSCRGTGAGDQIEPIELSELKGKPVLLVNPRVPLPTSEVYAGWDGIDHGPLSDWREGRNDLQPAAIALVPQIETVLAWLSAQPGAEFIRMSGSGASCFAFFDSEESRDSAADRVPREWWRLATTLR